MLFSKKTLLVLAVVLVAIFAFSSVPAMADLGRNPAPRGPAVESPGGTRDTFDFRRPEIYAPRWVTGFPYQRNIRWDMDSLDPTITPPEYEGYDDDELQSSDFVQFTGDVQYYPGVGAGIDNTGGAVAKSGTIKFHIDNWDDENRVKHYWDEFVGIELGGGDINQVLPPNTVGMFPAPPAVVTGEVWFDPNDLGGGRFVDWVWYRIEPNPEWEEVVIGFEVPPGGEAYAVDMHIATECVKWDVPSLTGWGMLVLLLMLIATAIWVLRKRRVRATA